MNSWILFSGHLIDAKDRPKPRFPASKENKARQEIRKRLKNEKENAKYNLKGIAGGACGGDILFHEVCEELGIPTEMYLALPTADFIKACVSYAGQDWVERFDKLTNKPSVHILSETGITNNNENVWERTNSWMLEIALENEGENMTLIALWDGKEGDGKGGTKHLVDIAKEQGAKIVIIDINKI